MAGHFDYIADSGTRWPCLTKALPGVSPRYVLVQLYDTKQQPTEFVEVQAELGLPPGHGWIAVDRNRVQPATRVQPQETDRP